MIKLAISAAIILATAGKDRSGHMHKVFVMTTSPKWSAL